MSLSEKLKKHWEKQLNTPRNNLPNWILKKKFFHEHRGNKVPRITGSGKLFHHLQMEGEEEQIQYDLSVTFFVKQGDTFYHEEEQRVHQAIFRKGKLIKDEEVNVQEYENSMPTIEPIDRNALVDTRFSYDRRVAVRYAERWWNDYNPAYRDFDVDCTNYVSQCLHAGGAPMRGAPNRSNGWWYNDANWSYSWAVAHALRWYLSGSNSGLQGKEVENPEELSLGDVICYDFEGDGRWNHNTIVVAKDQEGMPLVNAHTTNSRHRYWSYEDSYAWKTDTKYKFFKIGE
ncbi:amidase domain-containing protein [Radiobacillus sp. PE A8.2]|uniref:amidase domain-containing protein n=1 Tax=Radiobacillus sp. PE A8.2 TaxID=3380349 RepID=UPI0038909CBA